MLSREVELLLLRLYLLLRHGLHLIETKHMLLSFLLCALFLPQLLLNFEQLGHVNFLVSLEYGLLLACIYEKGAGRQVYLGVGPVVEDVEDVHDIGSGVGLRGQ